MTPDSLKKLKRRIVDMVHKINNEKKLKDVAAILEIEVEL